MSLSYPGWPTLAHFQGLGCYSMTNDMISAGNIGSAERVPNVVLHVSCSSLPVVLHVAGVFGVGYCQLRHVVCCCAFSSLHPDSRHGTETITSVVCALAAFQLQLDANITMDGTAFV